MTRSYWLFLSGKSLEPRRWKNKAPSPKSKSYGEVWDDNTNDSLGWISNHGVFLDLIFELARVNLAEADIWHVLWAGWKQSSCCSTVTLTETGAVGQLSFMDNFLSESASVWAVDWIRSPKKCDCCQSCKFSKVCITCSFFSSPSASADSSQHSKSVGNEQGHHVLWFTLS